MARSVLLMLLFLFGETSAEDVKTVNPGDDVTLPCRSDDPNIRAVEWTRPDLKPEYVFLSVDGHFKPEEQNPSFQDRVQLVDRDLKDRNVSLTLKNVTRNDEGTYECRVKVAGSTRRKRDIKTEPIRRVRLEVTGADGVVMKHGDKKDGVKEDGVSTRMHLGLIAAVFLVCSSLVGVGVMKSKRCSNNDPEAPAADEAERAELNTSQT